MHRRQIGQRLHVLVVGDVVRDEHQTVRAAERDAVEPGSAVVAAHPQVRR